MFCFLLATAAPPARADGGRWREMVYGVSLQPPDNALRYEGPRVIWRDPTGFWISFEIVRSQAPATLDDFATSTLVQASFSRNASKLLDQEGRATNAQPQPERIAERPAMRMYFEIESQGKDPTPRIHGQTLVMLEPYAAAVLKLNTPQTLFPRAQEAFDRVVASLQIPFPDELNAAREKQVDAADAWLGSLGPTALEDRLGALRWYRLVKNREDVGYLRVAATRDPQTLRLNKFSPPGTLVQLNRRRFFEGRPFDTQTRIFLSADGAQEQWSRKSTLRGGDGPRAGLTHATRTDAPTWAQTGLRAAAGAAPQVLTVVTDRPPPTQTVARFQKHAHRFFHEPQAGTPHSSAEVKRWLVPDRAYLAQAELWSFAALLPNEAAEYCFAAYHPQSGKPGLRQVRVVPQEDGGKLVLDQPNSRLGPIHHLYSADGQLVRLTHPDGLTLLPATPQELAEIWGTPVE